MATCKSCGQEIPGGPLAGLLSHVVAHGAKSRKKYELRAARIRKHRDTSGSPLEQWEKDFLEQGESSSLSKWEEWEKALREAMDKS